MVARTSLLNYLSQLLKPERFSDYGPNGLQVEGRDEIEHIITGVSICEDLIDRAIEKDADTILVHHGMFWQKDDPRIIGIRKKRLAKLLQHDINLIGYHLPLDAHETLGNNVQLAKRFGLTIDKAIVDEAMLFVGHLDQPMRGEELAEVIANELSRQPLYIPAKKPVERVAWCSGGGADFIHAAIDEEVDAFITGEIYERTVPIARESNLHLYSAGHHATERYGIQALGETIADQFQVTVEFIDIDNPV